MKIKSEVAEWLHTRPNWQQETVDRVLKKERVFNTAAKNEETLALVTRTHSPNQIFNSKSA